MLPDLRRHKRFMIAAAIGLLGGLLAWFWRRAPRQRVA